MELRAEGRDLSGVGAVVVTEVRKRDGQVVTFDFEKIVTALREAGRATGELDEEVARRLAVRVVTLLHTLGEAQAPDVEWIQDLVEEVLLAMIHPQPQLDREPLQEVDRARELRPGLAINDPDLGAGPGQVAGDVVTHLTGAADDDPHASVTL